jgi:hypothetical protein
MLTVHGGEASMKKSRMSRIRATALRRFRAWVDVPVEEIATGIWEGSDFSEHEEGWSRRWVRLNMRSIPFTFHLQDDGTDCDGRMTHDTEGYYAPKQRTGLRNRISGIWKPERLLGRFVVDNKRQRDYAAEAMGY